MSDALTPTNALAAAIRALAEQYRDLAVAEELNHVAIRAEQYPDMPATGRMQKALWDAEEVLLDRLAAIQSGVGEIRSVVATMQAEHSAQEAGVAALQAAFQTLAETVDQLVTDVAALDNRDARQFADAAQHRAGLADRLDRIEQSLTGRHELVVQHLNYEARIAALEAAFRPAPEPEP